MIPVPAPRGEWEAAAGRATRYSNGTMSDTPGNSYDDVPYDSFAYPHTHPARLATVATLFGLAPPDVARCRVLELGCAAGGNIIPMAEAFPHSAFVGIDLSGRQIADGTAVVRECGLTNVRLEHASITDLDGSYGEFDYVLCHGVFSWVPPAVQEAIFAACARHLAPNGVAFVSYNTYPGWHMRGMIRDMMRYHALQFDRPDERVGQARALLDFLAQTTQKEAGAYGVLLRSELDLLKHQSDHYLYHEQLEEHNQPLYFHQFVARAEPHGLRYLGEALVNTMLPGNFGPDVQKTLAQLAPGQIQTEQYLDFVRNRTFRETLLVRADNVPNWEMVPERVFNLHVSCGAKAVGRATDPGTKAPMQFRGPSGMVLSASNPVFKAAMMELIGAWPGTVHFPELLDRSAARLGRPASEEDRQALAAGVLNAHVSSDLVELSAAPVRFARVPPERPVALVHARAAAKGGRTSVSNRRHETVRLDDLSSRLLPLLDGTRDRAALVEALAALARAGELTVQRGGQALADADAIRASVAGALEDALGELARDALLAEV
ncbi:tRNA (guanine-N(7)-)-methyltransferase [Gemmata obscuriglobus]|nr:methyltransferase regulatory domain-containing protein [Gemmata obscuriglobus]QEG26218.1 tRNA (guanine-N(7)-)-methyltransferase [Gemmata obscuriglobus]VTS00943.1 Methyltransferase type 12 OS=Desulfatibacillum alkenivorans (strain AK-01) GN=Dalk_1878 PE=4 SV=1: Methyltransf_12: MethyTransf_Reg [Gemmata obscuriglobus UQM 2246]